MGDTPAQPSLHSLLDFSGKTAVVTGAGSGLGRAICGRLHEAGASICAVDIDLDGAQATVDALGSRAFAASADVRSAAANRAFAAAAADAFGRIDVVVPAAGVFFPTFPIAELPEEQWDRLIDINLKGTLLTVQACVPHMTEGGTIVNIASTSATRPARGLGHYAASKGGVVMLTKSFALELAPRIRANAVAPGSVDTPGTQRTAAAFAEATGADGAAVKAAYAARNPLGREGQPDDIARIVLFLASPLSSYINGETVLADGGILLT
jgi:NAD(P)-dependent dehydrogenase (short-subunit alcohol dehydrogenase family)